MDRRRIGAWFRQPGSGSAAAERLRGLDAAMARLPSAPFAHPEGPEAGTRVLVSQKHRVLYRLEADPADTNAASYVFVLRIYGPGQAGD